MMPLAIPVFAASPLLEAHLFRLDYFVKLKLSPVWQRLQSAKFSPPKARFPLWQLMQLSARAEALCCAACGDEAAAAPALML
jgi:hypothetical protein